MRAGHSDRVIEVISQYTALALKLANKNLTFVLAEKEANQNEPLSEDVGDDTLLDADQIASKFNGLERGVIPIGCNHLTMFIDVQQKCGNSASKLQHRCGNNAHLVWKLEKEARKHLEYRKQIQSVNSPSQQ